MRNLADVETAERIQEAIFGSVEDYESAVAREDKAALELQRGLRIRLSTSEREEAEKVLRGLADQLIDGPLLDLPEEILSSGLLESAEQLSEKLKGWKNDALHELLGDLQRAVASDASGKVREARLESLVRAVKEVIGFAPVKADKPEPKEAPKPPPMVEKFRSALDGARA